MDNEADQVPSMYSLILDMIDMDEKQVTVVYTGPAADSKIDLVDRNPGKY